MKKLFSLLCIILLMSHCDNPTTFENMSDYPMYEGNDLGFTYNPDATTFKLWSPGAQEARLHVYQKGDGDNLLQTYKMQGQADGVWSYKVSGNLKDKYYTFQVNQNGQWLQEKPDLYAVAVGVNGQRSMVIDLGETDPEGWDKDQKPDLKHPTDMIIYEMHIRDLSIHESSGIQAKGKYAGLTETGTKSPEGLHTGLDHIKSLGVTHVHLLPTFDHRSIDETRLDEPQYNWGYDPLNYNVPEGSFSSDPYNGKVRIREFKEMVKTFHENGIRVILDVVYNHTGQTEDSNFNQLVPDYFYRQNEDGTFSDASACGNETASERAMMRKYMIESVKYWVEEYHIDGFRFDLMGIHDIATMNELSESLHQIDPTIFVYGEGWTAGDSPLPVEDRALKAHTYKMEKVAAFSDDMRDGLKGSVFEHEQGGFVSNTSGTKESVKFGIVASTQHPQVDYEKVNYSDAPWAAQPHQTINYVSCHDNHTLFDKLNISRPDASPDDIIRMHKLAETLVLTSQGVPFIHAGMEFLRTKNGVENSYNSPDTINQIDWTRKAAYLSVFEYYRDLIALRKRHPAFRMPTTEMIQAHLVFMESPEQVVAYQLKDHANDDSWQDILLFFNGGETAVDMPLPNGRWTMVSNGEKIDESGLSTVENRLNLPAYSSFILTR